MVTFSITTLFLCGIAYVIGSIPTGFIIARLSGIPDIRRHGSGNIGATNVARTLGLVYFFIVLFFDFFKSYIFVTSLRSYGCSYYDLVCFSIALLIGNCYSIFLKGDGGKGVATLFGIISAFSTHLAIFFLIIWSLVILVSKMAALASLVAVLFLPLGSWYLQKKLLFFSFFALGFIFLRHKKNIRSFF